MATGYRASVTLLLVHTVREKATTPTSPRRDATAEPKEELQQTRPNIINIDCKGKGTMGSKNKEEVCIEVKAASKTLTIHNKHTK